MKLKKLPHQGLCNANYAFSIKNETYLLRVFGEKLNRKKEFKAQKKAHSFGLAPKPLILRKSFMIAEFAKGKHKNSLGKNDLKLLAKSLKKLHAIKINIKKYKLKKELSSYKKELVFCHCDLSSKNVLFHNNSIKFIDWEYAHLNDRYFDLASVCVEFGLRKKQEKYFLKCYLKKPKSHHFKKLKAYKKAYKKLCKHWLEKYAF